MKYLLFLLTTIFLVVICVPALAQQRYAQFMIMEDLPENFVAWKFCFTTEDGSSHEMKIEAGQWSELIRIGKTTDRVLVGACSEDDCGHIRVMGEIPSLSFSESRGELLISNLVIGSHPIPFEINFRWSTTLPISNSE